MLTGPLLVLAALVFASSPAMAQGSAPDKPKVMVLMEERVSGLSGPVGPEEVAQAEFGFTERLLALGFVVVDPATVRQTANREQARLALDGDNRAAAAIGFRQGAHIVILGRVVTRSAPSSIKGTNLRTVTAAFTVRAIRSDDARVIAVGSEQSARAHVDEVLGAISAIRDASTRLADRLGADMLNAWQQAALAQAQEIMLVISGLSSYRQLLAIMDHLQKGLPERKTIRQRQFTAGTAELAMEYGASTTALARELALREFGGVRLEPVNVTPNRVDARADLVSSGKKAVHLLWVAHMERGRRAFEKGQHDESENAWRAALKEAEGFGAQDPRLGTALNALAELLTTQTRHAEAEVLYRRSLSIRERAVGPDHPDVAETLTAMAMLYHSLRRDAEAETLLGRARGICERPGANLPPNHPLRAQIFENLARVYHAIGKVREADEAQARAAIIWGMR